VIVIVVGPPKRASFLPELPPMTVGDQNASPVARYHSTPSDPSSETTADACPRPTGFVAIPSATAREDSGNGMLAENASGSSRWLERGHNRCPYIRKSVQLILSFYRIELLFQRSTFSPQSSQKAIKCCHQILETRSRFNPHPLPPQLSWLI
jgi:hypothetical protein